MRLPCPDDTIAAIATPPGRGGIGIVRISGRDACSVARTICGDVPAARVAALRTFYDRKHRGQAIDQGIVLHFPAPNSFTGEDMIELHAHGSPVVLDTLLQLAVAAGARLARPGEFSERAFLNGKIDLAQAEAIADLIESASTAAARGAMRSLQGVFSAQIHAALEQLIKLRVYVEAGIDFPDEEIDLPADTELKNRHRALKHTLERILRQARTGVLLRNGATVVLAGRPNAGKSSLMNRLSGRDVAIVTAIPGTTRDVLRQELLIDDIPFHVIDTAGLRDGTDEIEREGVRRARAEISRADQLLLVIDSTQHESPDAILNEINASLAPPIPPVTVVMNKCDLSGIEAGKKSQPCYSIVAVSALTGAGIEQLKQHLKNAIGFEAQESGEFSARRRHLDALERTLELMSEGLEQLLEHNAPELLAEHLRLAQQSLGEITGEFGTEELLGRIFSGFCIGK